jgi:hypothetical protein
MNGSYAGMSVIPTRAGIQDLDPGSESGVTGLPIAYCLIPVSKWHASTRALAEQPLISWYGEAIYLK